MKLIQIYECFCDETRLRILNLLLRGPLCVCHIQRFLNLTQVNTSKHLSYMKERGIVEVTRYENWMIYSISKAKNHELESNLKCLQVCVGEYPLFKKDLSHLSQIKEASNEAERRLYQLLSKGVGRK